MQDDELLAKYPPDDKQRFDQYRQVGNPQRAGAKSDSPDFSELLEGAQRPGAAAAEDYSNQLAVRHQVREVLLAALLLAYIVARMRPRCVKLSGAFHSAQ